MIEDTYAEVFEGIYSRVIITADDTEVLRQAAMDATAMPSVVIGRTEGGIERWLDESETPDRRRGALLQFWGAIEEGRPAQYSVSRFERELAYRIRQDILVKPFTAVFDAMEEPAGTLDMMERVGHCGDGFEWEERRYEREMIIVPTMVPDFIIERRLGYATGVMGANFWYMCRTKEAVMEAGMRALESIHATGGVITPFDICSAGSKPETRFPEIGPTTNHPYCPSLKGREGESSKVPEGVHYIPEIVINGTSMERVREAMGAGIRSVMDVEGVVRISAGNYGGRLGQSVIRLREVVQ